MLRESKARKRNLTTSISLILFAVFYQFASTDLAAQITTRTNSLQARLSSKTSSSLKVSFSYNPRFPIEGQPVQFVDSSSGAPTSWTWDFGDGTTSTERNPAHVYRALGFKKVSLVASAGATSKRASRTVTVMPDTSSATFVFSPATPGPGQTVQFADTTAGTPTSWQWNFGDGATSTVKNPSHAYGKAGSYTVSLVAMNSSSSRQGSRAITVATVAVLAASFTHTPSLPVTNQSVQFTDTSTGSPTSWLWNFGDGGTSSAQHPLHTYTTAGSKNVTLTVTNSNGSNSTTRAISIGSPLAASFSYSPTSPTAGRSMQFTDTSTGSPTSWLWNFGDGGTTSLQNPLHTYTTAGSKTVTLTITNSAGSNTTTRTVTVGAALAASFNHSPASPTAGQSVQFTDTSTGTPTSWLWNFGDGATSAAQNPSHSYATAGSKTVTLTATGASGSNSTSRSVTVLAALTASFSFSPTSPAAGQSVQFTDTSVGTPSIWQWNFGDGSTSVSQNPAHSFASAGSYNVSLNIMNASGSNSTSRTVTVGAALAASFTYTPASPAVGQSVQFTDTSTGTPTSRSWNFGDGTTSTSQNPSHGYTTAGSKTVTLTVTNASGSNSTSRTVTVGAALAASFTYTPASPAVGQSVQFTDTSTGAPTGWSWSFGDGTTSTLKNPSHVYATSGSYTVSLTVAASSNSSTTSKLISVAPPATLEASFSFSPSSPAPGQTIAFRDSSTGAPTSWQWNFGDGGTSTAQNPSHSYTSEGSYSVVLIARNATGSGTVSRNVAVAASSDIVPADRLYDWGAYSGVPGGIPNRTTIYRTLTPSSTTAEINAAISACPSGQVVYLAAGVYNIGQVTFGSKSGVTLRGAGAGHTVISSSASQAIVNSYYTYTEAQGIAISFGHTKGSTAITLTSSPSSHFIAGNIVIIAEDADPDKWNTGIGTYYRTGLASNVYNLSASRCLRFASRIVSVAGNVVTLAAPIPIDFSSDLNVKAYAQNGDGGTSLCGVENLTIDSNSTGDRAISWTNADRCWVKNVEVVNCIGTIGSVFLSNCVQNEIRRCYIHDTPNYPTQSDGFGIMLYYGSTNCRIEDCIGDDIACLAIMNGSGANALIYNYTPSVGGGSAINVKEGIICNHGPHGFMNLFEGNIIPRWANDAYHGSSSHGTLFRNNIHGVDADGKTNERRLVDLLRGSYYHSVVGNIIGDSSYDPAFYELTGSPGHGADVESIYVLGYPNAGNSSLTPETTWTGWAGTCPDPAVASTLIRHGNYDYYNKGVVWNNNISSRTIPDSLLYSSKPGYFGALQWPPIGPDVAGLVTSIPAKARWDTYSSSGNLDDLF